MEKLRLGLNKRGDIIPLIQKKNRFFAEVICEGSGGSDTFWIEISRKKFEKAIENMVDSKKT